MDIENLKKLHKEYEDNYQNLSAKYEAAMKEKMLLKLERDRLLAKSDSLAKTVENLEDKINKENLDKSQALGLEPQELKPTTKTKITIQTKYTPFPEDKINPFVNQTLEAFSTKSIQMVRNFKKVIKSSYSLPLDSFHACQCLSYTS